MMHFSQLLLLCLELTSWEGPPGQLLTEIIKKF